MNERIQSSDEEISAEDSEQMRAQVLNVETKVQRYLPNAALLGCDWTRQDWFDMFTDRSDIAE